jgi:hypothetical protein
MPFALDSNPSNIELSDSINYLLANFGANLSADPNTGAITGPTGQTIAYLYQYLAIKYADSSDGASNFSNSPTNRLFYGIRNSNSSVESTNPADYLWQRVAGGFGTTKFLFYQTTGGRQIDIAVDTTNPTPNYVQDDGSVIDLDLLTAGKGRQVAYPTIYQWTSTTTPPARPSTTTTFTWATGTYGAPSGWTSTPATVTTPGYYLWAITVPLSASPNDLTSVCDWTNTSYAIYNLSSNGATGSNGLNFINAYRVQNQSSPTPTFTATTSGATIPAGWVGTAPSVAVGEVLWYIQGQYNSSAITINGIAPNTTAWTGPIAASIFQDIRSDNWNGSNPPTFGSPGTYGTTGYYIQRTTGDVFFNNGIFRSDINTAGDAVFNGDNPAVEPVDINGTTYNVDYSSSSLGATNAPGRVRAGVYGFSNSLALFPAPSSLFNVGVIGIGHNGISCPGIGVVGQGDTFGGFFSGDQAGLVCRSSSGINVALEIQSDGRLLWNGYSIVAPTGNTTQFLRNDGTWATVSGSGTVTSVSGTGSVSGITLSGTVTTSGSLSLGGSLSLTTGDLTATAPGSAFYLSGGGWSSTSPIMTSATANSGSATVSGNNMNLLGSTSTGIAGAYIGTSGSGSTVTFGVQTTSPSDIRLKEEVADADLGLSFVNQLRPVSYKLKADPRHQKGYGFIADEVEDLIGSESSLVYEEPNWQVGDEVGFKTIHYPSYIAVLTKAIQELSAKVDEQQKLIESLQNKG